MFKNFNNIMFYKPRLKKYYLVGSIIYFRSNLNLNVNLPLIVMKIFVFLSIFFLFKNVSSNIQDSEVGEENTSGWYQIEGKVYSPEIGSENTWQQNTIISINGGEFQGFLKEDGSFIISKVPFGSYVVDIINPDYNYEPVS